MSRNTLLTVAAGIVLVAIAALLILRSHDQGEGEGEPQPTALITVAHAQSGRVRDIVSAFGVIQADPAGALTVAAPRAAIVTRTLVRAGEAVSAGQPIVEIANAPASELAYREASGAAAAAEADLARVQRLYDQHLAANDQLIAARKALSDAQAALAAQLRQGAARGRQVLTAPTAGVVTNVSATPGDHVAQDAPLAVLARAGAAVVKIALEPAAGAYRTGQQVLITPTYGGPATASRLTMVGRAADQATRTISASAPAPAALPIGAAVKAEVVTGEHQGLLVPRASVVFDETGAHVFTIAASKAHRVFVTVGGDHGDAIEVSGALAPGAMVAVEGAYELQDGMAVRIRGR